MLNSNATEQSPRGWRWLQPQGMPCVISSATCVPKGAPGARPNARGLPVGSLGGAQGALVTLHFL
jgi:hypothetical protein